MRPLMPRAERGARQLTTTVGRVRWLRAALLHPVVSRPGYWFATAVGLVWGTVVSGGRLSRRGGVVVARRCPNWAFARGGTTIGAVFLTNDLLSDAVLEHESAHRSQWRKYGLVFPLLYLAAWGDALTNRFEVEAGLEKAGYIRPQSRNVPPPPHTRG